MLTHTAVKVSALLTVVVMSVQCEAQKALDARGVFKKTASAVVRVETSSGVGTGFAINGGKYVVTCRHVLEIGNDDLEAGVWTPILAPIDIEVDGVSCVAILAEDWLLDIAVLQVGKPIKSALTLRSGQAEPGERAYTIGFPLGVREHTISEGLVSALRKIPVANSPLGANLEEFVQTTAAISEGSSGSPLLDTQGRVIGMVQATYRQGQQNNIALSARAIRKVIDRGMSEAKRPIARAGAVSGGRVVLGKLGQAITETKILSKPGGRAYYTAKPYEFLVLRSSGVPGYYKVLLQNGKDGYVKSDTVSKLPYDVTRPVSGNGAETATLLDSTGQIYTGPSPLADKARSMIGFDFAGASPTTEGRTSWAFIAYLHKLVGEAIAPTIEESLKQGREVKKLEHLIPGDRLYFAGAKKGTYSEAAIYLGGGKAVRLGTDAIVKAFDLQSDNWLARLVAARR